MDIKKNIIIWANCQGGCIGYMLTKYYSSNYNVYYLINYDYINNNIILPEYFYKCDIFLYQNYSKTDNEYFNLETILNKLPKDSLKISFPTLHRNYLQFCYDVNSPENIKSITSDKPHGEFFYGIGNIRKKVLTLKSQNISDDIIETIILNEIKNNDFICEEQIKRYENETLQFLENKALSSDIPEILYFIKDNYKKIRLFHNPNHPNGILLNELCKNIFNKLQLNYVNESNNIDFLDKSLKDWKMPIFNSIIKYYDLIDIDNKSYCNVDNTIVNIDTYIKNYIHFLLKYAC